MGVAESRVALPREANGPIEVYVNGVAQRGGVDYRVEDGSLVFAEELHKEGRLGFWRWTSIVFGVAGTYRRNDVIDVIYELGGRRGVEPDLPLEA